MLFNKKIIIENRVVSKDSPSFIIAEAGVNHGGDIEVAKKLIDLAVVAQADAVKFQTFKADSLILKEIKKAPYQRKTTSVIETQYEMLKRLEVSKNENIELSNYCLSKGIIFLTTPFDEESLNELDDLELPAYKVASTDLTNLPFLIKIAQKGKPIILSTGMSYLSEVKIALDSIYEFNRDVILLQCTANYPIKDSEANLAVLDTYKRNFDILLGYSDHSVGVGAAPFSIPMGAKILEKHFTLDKSMEGPDHSASMNPEELIDFVKTVRKVDEYMGNPIKEPSDSEISTRKSLQKCLVARTDILKGDFFAEKNITAKRTGGIGISPIYTQRMFLKKAKKNYKKNQIIEE
jgi:N,N'-diacetyllegionaminate synthase